MRKRETTPLGYNYTSSIHTCMLNIMLAVAVLIYVILLQVGMAHASVQYEEPLGGIHS